MRPIGTINLSFRRAAVRPDPGGRYELKQSPFEQGAVRCHIATIRGPWLLHYRPESLATPTLVPWLFLFTGQRVLTVAADGTREHVTWRGRFVDLCAKLAATP